jgi:phosphate transport system substrate-binding protein
MRKLMLSLAAVAMILSACGSDDDESGGGGSDNLSGSIRIDGSSTVGPLSEAAAEFFGEENSDVRVTVGTSGTGGGFKKFCAGETDISDASREIDDTEKALCASKGITYEQLQIANDGLSLVVNNDNTWAECLTTAQLKKIWDQGSTVKNWKEGAATVRRRHRLGDIRLLHRGCQRQGQAESHRLSGH